jgi:omega-6 fatty acid desaturase (delta-12 desaturase)
MVGFSRLDICETQPADAAPRTSIDLLRATKAFAVERRGRSWFDLVSTLLLLAGLVAFTLLDVPLYGQAGAGFLAGLVAVRLFVIYHDVQHGAILRRSRVAHALMRLYGVLTLNPPSPWNRSHNYHHANNSTTPGASFGSFPVMTVEAYRKAGRWERFGYLASRHPLTILAGYLTVFLFGMTLRPFLIRPRAHLDCAAALLVHAALIAGFAWFDPEGLVFTLWIPLVTASALGAYLFYAQHNFPGVRLRPRADWDLAWAAHQSSSHMVLSPLLHWLTANIGYHQVHHLNPRIPFYRLAEALEAIPELQAAGTTSLSVGDIRRCLRLKLWDPARDRMVPLSDAA